MGCMISCDRQALLGWLTYRVYALVLVRIMETHRVLFEGGFFFATFALSWARLRFLIPLLRTLFNRFGFQRKMLPVWMGLSILWLAL